MIVRALDYAQNNFFGAILANVNFDLLLLYLFEIFYNVLSFLFKLILHRKKCDIENVAIHWYFSYSQVQIAIFTDCEGTQNSEHILT